MSITDSASGQSCLPSNNSHNLQIKIRSIDLIDRNVDLKIYLLTSLQNWIRPLYLCDLVLVVLVLDMLIDLRSVDRSIDLPGVPNTFKVIPEEFSENFARPKSQTFTFPSAKDSIKMFALYQNLRFTDLRSLTLRSRCITPLECKYTIPRHIPKAISSFCDLVIVTESSCMKVSKFPPGINCVTRQMSPSFLEYP